MRSTVSAPTTQPRFRDRFANLAESTYLVSHSMGAAPFAVRDELAAYWDAWASNGPEAWESWLPQIGEIADGIGAIVGVPAGATWLAPNVSILQAAIGTALDFTGERNEVVYEALQFPSLTYVWDAWQRYGARICVVPSDDSRTIPTERIVAAITEKTAVVVLSHAYYVSGALIDVPPIVERAREVGALVILDVYQTAGVVPFSLTDLDVDIAVGGSHKWLCGGPGCGFITLKPALHSRFAPAVTGWMAHAEPFAFEAAPIRYASGPARFGTGTPTIPGYLAARPGHAFIREAGVPAIREHNLRLTTRIAHEALERGWDVRTPLDPDRRAGWIGIRIPNQVAVTHQLIERRIFLDQRPDCGLRIGPHIYTSDEEIDTLFAALDELIT